MAGNWNDTEIIERLAAEDSSDMSQLGLFFNNIDLPPRELYATSGLAGFTCLVKVYVP